jgi:hypothetical protein
MVAVLCYGTSFEYHAVPAMKPRIPTVQLRDLEFWRLKFIMCLGKAEEVEYS